MISIAIKGNPSGQDPAALGLRQLVRAADSLRAQGYFRVPLVLYDAVLVADDKDESARLGKGISEGKLGRHSDARDTLRPLFTLHDKPRPQDGYWAYVLERTGDPEGATVWYERALAGLSADDPWVKGHYAYCLEKIGEIPEAHSAYCRVLAEHPGDSWARKRLALFSWRLGSSQAAWQLLEEGKTDARGAAMAYLNAAEVALIMGDHPRSQRELGALRGLPSAGPAHRLLIDLLGWVGGGALSAEFEDANARYPELLARIEALDVSVHRDFDDLGELVRAQRGDLQRWRALSTAFVK